MAQQGWVRIHRKMKECWIYDDKPFDRTHAWIDLLLRANHQDRKIILGKELIEVKRGSFITSELKLMDCYGWSKTKLRSFLKLLKDDGMIFLITDKKKTTVNIVNYCLYQDTETTKEPQEDHKKTTKEPQEDTNKNDKECIKNDKNDKTIILTMDEEAFIDILKEIDNYPIDLLKDKKMFNKLELEYSDLDLIEVAKEWRNYKEDKPLTNNANPRSQFNTSCAKYAEWGKCSRPKATNPYKDIDS